MAGSSRSDIQGMPQSELFPKHTLLYLLVALSFFLKTGSIAVCDQKRLPLGKGGLSLTDNSGIHPHPCIVQSMRARSLVFPLRLRGGFNPRGGHGGFPGGRGFQTHHGGSRGRDNFRYLHVSSRQTSCMRCKHLGMRTTCSRASLFFCRADVLRSIHALQAT